MAAIGSAILAAHRAKGNQDVAQLFTRKELVGKGAYGGVYKGIHNDTGTVVALKVIDLDTPDDDISEIQREVALLSELRDAARYNITLYHGSYLHGHELWIAMDFASGGSIRTLMKSGPIEEKYAALIIREVLVALSFLHRQGIIHRDVKAANVLLTQTGKILLCDFGVAAHLQTNSKRSTFTGTPLWMAPEVITDGKLYDTQADVWSLGITLYEIATGNPPHFGMEPLRACALIPTMSPPRLEGGTWSNGMREFLASCLEIDPSERPTADELSKSKWIRSASKLSMVILRELIVRYVSWIQSGGQRHSIVGLDGADDVLQREDTFELAEDRWDFDVGGGEDEGDEGDFGTGLGRIEPLGDEPARAPVVPKTLDELAAQGHARPPKVQPLPRANHPLLRLFDEESNPYTQSQAPTTISLPTGLSSLNTVKPTISIPSFDEIDDMASSSVDPSPFASSFGGASSSNGFGFGGASSASAGGYGGYGGAGGGGAFSDYAGGGAFGFGAASGLGLADDLMSPAATVRGNPFAWQAPRFGGATVSSSTGNGASPWAPSSPRVGRSDTPDSSLWGGGSGSGGGTHMRNSSSTPTEAHFPASDLAPLPLPSSSSSFAAAVSAPHVTSSPSLPSLTTPSSLASTDQAHLNRPFGAPATSSSSAAAVSPAARRRADTAPSSRPGEPGAYPPLGMGIPRPGATGAALAPSASAGGYPPLGPGLPRRFDSAAPAPTFAPAPAPAPTGMGMGQFGPSTSWDLGPPGTSSGHARGGSASSSVGGGPSGEGGSNRPFGFGGAVAARDLNRPFGLGASAGASGGRERGWSNATEGGGWGLRARAGSEAGNRRAALKITTGQGAPLPFGAASLASPATVVPQTPLSAQQHSAYPASPHHNRKVSHSRKPSSSSSAVPYGFFPVTTASPPSFVPPPTASASSSFSAPASSQMQRGDSQTSPRTIPGFAPPPGSGHRPRLSHSQTTPAQLPFAAGGYAAPTARHLRTYSSTSSLLGEDAHTPLAAPSLPALAELPTPSATPAPLPSALVTAPGQRGSAIGYPFPPVGDLAVPSSSAGLGGAASVGSGSASSSVAQTPAAAPAPPHGPGSALPRVAPLDYAALSQGDGEAAARELERQVAQLAQWLEVVGEGLGRVLDGDIGDLGFELGSDADEAGGSRRMTPVEV
ncbi:hypothetical protein JCM8208_000282 [Rhodotorula glutinis]